MNDPEEIDYIDIPSNQNPFEMVEFAENPEKRCPVVLILDNSYSMSGEPIRELNRGVETLLAELSKDSLAAKRVELGIISFGPVEIIQEFSTVDGIQFSPLEAKQMTPTGEAVETAMRMLRERKDKYKQNGIQYYRPWVILISDGAPTDNWQSAAKAALSEQQAGGFELFSIGVEGADMNVLGQFSTRQPLLLQGTKFNEFFVWLSASTTGYSNSREGDKLNIPNPSGWAVIDV